MDKEKGFTLPKLNGSVNQAVIDSAFVKWHWSLSDTVHLVLYSTQCTEGKYELIKANMI